MSLFSEDTARRDVDATLRLEEEHFGNAICPYENAVQQSS
jgi:hypothetical protein